MKTMKSQTIILHSDSQRRFAKKRIDEMPQDYVVTFKEPTRTNLQNARMWACLADISKQVDWYGFKLTDWEWKDVLTAALKGQRTVPGIDGGFVVLGQRTSKMGVSDMSDLLELINAFGAQQGVQWSDERIENA